MKKNSKKKKFNLKNLDKQEKTLLITMALLIVLVAILGITVLYLKGNAESKKANIIIPILEKQTKNEISVELAEMKAGETKEYIFKISNYKGKDVNNESIDYNITITPSDSATIKLYKDEATKNLIANEKYEIKNNLPKNKKAEDEYHMIIKTTKKTQKTDRITLKINS